MIKLIALDWDDVVTRGAKDGYFQCYHEAVIGVEVHLDPAEEHKRILAKWSKPHREELGELLKEHPELVERAAEIYEQHLFGDTYVNALIEIPGINKTLLRLKEKYILTVATGCHPKILKEKVIPKFNIPDVFTEIISSYDIQDEAKRKPHPYMIEKMMQDQDVKPEETIFVGDAKSDVEMARAAGVIPVVVLTGHLSALEAQELDVEHIISDFTQLESVLEKLS
jgi:phosphoglycolate phosphatase-like HAD superfamily hydrolase